jgi:hypothetical protein
MQSGLRLLFHTLLRLATKNQVQSLPIAFVFMVHQHIDWILFILGQVALLQIGQLVAALVLGTMIVELTHLASDTLPANSMLWIVQIQQYAHLVFGPRYFRTCEWKTRVSDKADMNKFDSKCSFSKKTSNSMHIMHQKSFK